MADVTKSLEVLRVRRQTIKLANVPNATRAPKAPAGTTMKNQTGPMKTPGPRPGLSSNPRKIRFEYHPIPVLKVVFSAAPKRPCDHHNSTIPVVIPSRRESDATIFVTEEFEAGIPSCDYVTGNVQIFNNLGEEVKYVDAQVTAKNSAFTASEWEMLKVCAGPKGCKRPIQFENPKIKPRKAHVSLKILTGRPNENAGTVTLDGKPAPYTKQFKAVMTPPGRKPVMTDVRVVVTGQKQQGEGKSISIPEYMPLLVIHDPPGGSSYSEYNNAKVHVEMEVEHVDYAANMKLGLGLWALGGGNTGQCAGLGFMVCMKMLLGKIKGGLYKDKDFDDKGNYLTEKTGKFEITFSYKTSAEPKNAGIMSDMYLVPGLNIMFLQVHDIRFNYDKCKATLRTKTQWVLARGGKNRDIFAWLSHEDILKREIPKLKMLLKEEKAKKSPNHDKLRKLTEGLSGWRKAIDQNKKAHKQAAAGTLTKAVAYQEDFNTPLAPEDLINKADRLDTHAHTGHKRGLLASSVQADSSHNAGILKDLKNKVKDSVLKHKAVRKAKKMFDLAFPSQKKKPQKVNSPLLGTSSIKFSGGGSKLKYRLTKQSESKKTTFTNKLDEDDFDHDSTTKFTVFGIGIKLKTLLKYDYKKKTDSSPSTSKSDTQTVGFTLGDPDVGDEFTVDVLIDPVYKTYLFHTAAGVSKCPAEAGTLPRERPKITLNGQPLSPPEPNQPALFHLMLMNNADETNSYEFFLEANTNGDGLVHVIDGSKTAHPIVYNNLKPRNGMQTVVEFLRGPEKYAYKPVTVGLRSKCEPSRKSEVQLHVDFLQPCSKVRFASNILETKTFVVNKVDSKKKIGSNSVRIVAWNPEIASRSWAKDSRLLKVVARYRPHGTLEWKPAYNNKKEEIDFAKHESKLGYSTSYWDVGPLADGKYDLQLKTFCKPTGSEAAGMDGDSTPVVTGLVDRRNPQQFGAVEPKNGIYYPGDVLSVSFDEPIKCGKPYAFNMNLKVNWNETAHDAHDAHDAHGAHDSEDDDEHHDEKEATASSPKQEAAGKKSFLESLGSGRVFNKRNMLVVCEDRKISVTFTALHQYEEMMGKTAVFTVSHAEDIAGNEQKTSAVSKFTVKKIDTHKALVQVRALRLRPPPASDVSQDNALVEEPPTASELHGELVDLLQLQDPGRLKVTQVVRSRLGGFFVDLKIFPSETSTAKSPVRLANELHSLIESLDEFNRKSGSDQVGIRLPISVKKHMRMATVDLEPFVTDITLAPEDEAKHKVNLMEVAQVAKKILKNPVSDLQTSQFRAELNQVSHQMILSTAIIVAVLLAAIVLLVRRLPTKEK